MADQSEFENRYFIDGQRYNCPFCNVRGAKYSVVDSTNYHKNDDAVIYEYITSCDLCQKRSTHLSNWAWGTGYNNPFIHAPYGLKEDLRIKYLEAENLDSYFFYHFPTSFFTINELIPKDIRDLVSEAESCKEMSYMTGASGCLRRAIYKFLKKEKAEGANYEDKIKGLKQKYPQVESTYFDVLANIKDMNDDDLHEDDWEPWKGSDFAYLISCVKEILEEVYVVPVRKKERLDKISKMKGGRNKGNA